MQLESTFAKWCDNSHGLRENSANMGKWKERHDEREACCAD